MTVRESDPRAAVGACRQAIELSYHLEGGWARSQAQRGEASIPQLLTRVVHDSLVDHDVSPVVLSFVSGQRRERVLLSTPSANNEQSDDTELTAPIQRLASAAIHHFPRTVGVTAVHVDWRPVGTTSTPTERLAISSTRTVTQQRLSRANPLERFIEDVIETERPHVVQVVANLDAGETIRVAVRAADFSQDARWHTQTADAAYHEAAAMPSLPEFFTGLHATSNRALRFEHGWRHRSDSPRHRDGNQPRFEREQSQDRRDDHATIAAALAASDEEYYSLIETPSHTNELMRRYHALNATPWLPVDAAALSAFCPYPTQTYDSSPWSSLLNRSHPSITLLADLRKESPTERSPPVSPLTPPTDDLNPISTLVHEDCTELGKHAANWLADIDHSISGPPDEMPAASFVRRSPRGTDAVYVIPGTCLDRGELVATAGQVDAHHSIDGLLVVTESLELAQRARRTLQQPFRIRNQRPETYLYSQPQPLATDTQVAVRPADSPAVNWIRAVDGDLVCLHDSDVVAKTSTTNDATTLIEALPRTQREPTKKLVRDATGTPRKRYDTLSEFQADWTPIKKPARPSRLLTGREAATVLTTDGNQFTDPPHDPAWTQSSAGTQQDSVSMRDHCDKAARHFLRTYTIPASNNTIELDTATELFGAWLRPQTDNALPRSLRYPLGNASTTIDDSLHDRPTEYLPRRSWRYPPHS